MECGTGFFRQVCIFIPVSFCLIISIPCSSTKLITIPFFAEYSWELGFSLSENRVDEAIRIFRFRTHNHVVRKSLLHNLPVAENDHPVTKLLNQRKVMTDKKIRKFLLLLQLLQ